jgi:hypothetical protein
MSLRSHRYAATLVVAFAAPLLFAARRAEAGGEASILLCDSPEACRSEMELARRMGAEGERKLYAAEALLELDAGGWSEGADQKKRFDEALVQLRRDAAAGRWKQAEESASTALDALDRWGGTVERASLFEIYYLQGAARLHMGENKGHAQSFQEAAAIADGRAGDDRGGDTEASRAYTDELRKLTLAGRGHIAFVLPQAGTKVFVDGEAVQADVPVSLMPATHRVTAVRTGEIRSFKADVPVLAERTSTIRVIFPQMDSVDWVSGHLSEAFDTLRAPNEVADLLVTWCDRYEVSGLRLLRFEGTVRRRPTVPVAISGTPDTRPKASEGEAVDLGDGLPTTYEDQVLAEREARLDARPGPEERRLRVVYFDPSTRQFQADARTEARLEADPAQRFRIGGQVGVTSLMGNTHGAFDVTLAVREGPVVFEGRLGLIRTQALYNLYEDWQDHDLYHLFAGVRWEAPSGLVRPYVAGGPEIYAPVAFGAGLHGGAWIELGAGWQVAAEGIGLAEEEGMGWGFGLALARAQ